MKKEMMKLSRKAEIEKILFSKSIVAALSKVEGLTPEDEDNLKDIWSKLTFLEEKFTDPAFKDAPKSSLLTAIKLNNQIYAFATLMSTSSQSPQSRT